MKRALALLFAVLLLSSAARAQVLAAMQEEIQEQGQWCWAAVTCAILNYYGGDWSQCEVAELTRQVSDWAEHDFGSDNCCAVPDGACNYSNENEKPPNGSIEDLLERNGIDNDMELRVLTESEVVTEAAAFRPFVMRREYNGAIGHFVAARGMSGGFVHFMDPWPGEGFGMGVYDDVVGGTGHNYVWTSTNILFTAPVCACSAIDACCDGCRPMNEGGGCDDGELCTHTDQCANGVCGGTGYTCDDGNVCTDDSCDGAGDCGSVANTAPCDDGDACTQGDACVDSECVSGDAVPCGDEAPVVGRAQWFCGATSPSWWMVVGCCLVDRLRRRRRGAV